MKTERTATTAAKQMESELAEPGPVGGVGPALEGLALPMVPLGVRLPAGTGTLVGPVPAGTGAPAGPLAGVGPAGPAGVEVTGPAGVEDN